MKKILVFGMTENPGGMESVIMNYYRNIPKDIIQFDFLTNVYEMAYEDEVKLLGSKVFKVTARSENAIKFKKEVTDFFSENAATYDVFWFNTCSLANITYLQLAKKYGIKKIILHCHNAQNMDSKLRGLLHCLNRIKAIKLATDFWTCSHEADQWFFGKSACHLNIQLIHNAIDVEKFRFDEQVRQQVRQELNIADDTILLGNVGRLHFQKNQSYLLDILYQLHKINKAYKLILIGSGEDLEKLKLKVIQLQLEKQVVFVSATPHIFKYYHAMDIFVFPSVFEGLPVAPLEAQANGLPVLSSTNVSKEIKVLNNVSFMSLSDCKHWAKHILTVENSRISYQQIIEQFKVHNFDIKTQVMKFIALIERE